MAPTDPRKAAPPLLIFKHLHRPVDIQRRRLRSIEDHLQAGPLDPTLLQGLFVLAIAGMETMLSGIYRYYLHAVPDAFQFHEEKVSRAALAANAITQDIISRRIDRHVNDVGYERFAPFMKRVFGVLKLSGTPLDAGLIDRLVEAKETRNLLLHNDLRVNAQYTEKAGPRARASHASDCRLPFSREYVATAVADISSLVEGVSSRLHQAYSSYTRISAFRELWYYLFNSPIMIFEDYWHLDAAADEISGSKRYHLEPQLANSERMFLAVLREHVDFEKRSDTAVNMVHLDSRRQEQMLYLLRTMGTRNFLRDDGEQ